MEAAIAVCSALPDKMDEDDVALAFAIYAEGMAATIYASSATPITNMFQAISRDLQDLVDPVILSTDEWPSRDGFPAPAWRDGCR
jgi:hypothetical protein